MIGTGTTLSLGLGLLLALGQVPADIPEGFATIATFKKQGVPRRRRLLLAAGLMIPIFLGATIGYWAVRGQPEVVKMSLLAFTAGILTTVVVEEIVPEAHEGEEARDAGERVAEVVHERGTHVHTVRPRREGRRSAESIRRRGRDRRRRARSG